MKQVTILFSFLLLAMISLNAQAQIKIPKAASDLTKSENSLPTDAISDQLVKALNPGKDLDISADQLLKLEDNNKSYVSDLMGVFNGSGSDDEKNMLAEGLLKDRKGFLNTLMGANKVTKYYKLIKPKVEPLIKKYALAKFLM